MNSKLSAAGGSTFDSGAYTDLNRLNQLKVGKDRDSEANIRKVAQEFESLFLNEMMKSMRSAGEVFAEGNYLNSNETKTYQEMHDQQLAVTISKEGGLGLADVLTRQLSKTKSYAGRANPFAEVNGALQGAPQKPVGSSATAVTETRDDSRLINQRRLALPGKLSERQVAGIVPSAERTQAAQPLAGNDWAPARAFAAPERDSVADQGRVSVTGVGKSVFASRNDFIETLLPMAIDAAERIGVDPRYLVAQAALETGWGKSVIRQKDGSSSHNLFGIKSHRGWDGESARVMTTEYKGGQAVKEAASFRAYNSFEQSFHDFVSFLQRNGRYQEALDSAQNPERFVRELQEAGYATDPQYARKISQIARGMQIYQTVASVDGETTRT